MKGVSIKEARLLDQWLHTNITAATWRDLINFLSQDISIINKAVEKLDKSDLYKKIGTEIEDRAKQLVKEKCEPEWNRISEEMKPLGELRNKLAEKKNKGKEWGDEDEVQLEQLDKEISTLSTEYQKVTDEANAELNEFKDKRINEEQGSAFLLDDEEYNLVGKYCGF